MLIDAPKGITLIEMLISISILGILVVVAVPSFNYFIKNYRVNASADEIYHFLSTARTEAVKRNANVYISLNTGNDWCLGMNVGSTCDCSVSSSCNLGFIKVSTSTQSTLAASAYIGNSFYYEGAHGVTNATGTLTLTKYGSSELITLSVGRMGSLKMCSTGIGGYSPC